MILKNYWDVMNNIMTEASVGTTKTETVKGTDGNDVTYLCAASNNSYEMQYVISNANLKGDVSMVVGTGDDDVTFNDYSLDTDVTSSISDTSLTVNHVTTSTGAKVVYTFSGTNDTANPITISEMGITKVLKTGSTGTPTTGTVLLAREVLSEGVVVPAGSGFVLTFEWTEG